MHSRPKMLLQLMFCWASSQSSSCETYPLQCGVVLILSLGAHEPTTQALISLFAVHLVGLLAQHRVKPHVTSVQRAHRSAKLGMSASDAEKVSHERISAGTTSPLDR